MTKRLSRLNAFAFVVTLLTTGALLLSLGNATGQQETPEPKMLRHVVMFQFKDASTDAEIQTVVDAFRQLPSKIREIADFEYGIDNSPEKLSGGLTHVFLVTFKSEEDRAAYLPHEAHLAFVEVLKPHLEKVTVVDYWAKK